MKTTAEGDISNFKQDVSVQGKKMAMQMFKLTRDLPRCCLGANPRNPRLNTQLNGIYYVSLFFLDFAVLHEMASSTNVIRKKNGRDG